MMITLRAVPQSTSPSREGGNGNSREISGLDWVSFSFSTCKSRTWMAKQLH